MRKTSLIIVGALALNLGVLAAAGYAADDHGARTSKAEASVSSYQTSGSGAGKVSMQDFHFVMLSATLTAKACMAHNGMVTTQGGVQGCKFQNQADLVTAMDGVTTR